MYCIREHECAILAATLTFVQRRRHCPANDQAKRTDRRIGERVA